MAVSQKHPGKTIVPWYNTHEWKYVYNLIYKEGSTPAQKKGALHLLQMWKVRRPILPEGVAGTLILLEAVLLDEQTESKVVIILRNCAIWRFLNLFGTRGDTEATVYKKAKANNIEDWVINIGYQFAHSPILPNLELLEMGLEYCLEWLKHNYWEPQASTLTDYIIYSIEEKFEAVIDLYCQINLFQYLNGGKELEDSHIRKLVTVESMLERKLSRKDILGSLFEFIKSTTNLTINADLISEIIIHNGSMLSREVFKDPNDCKIPYGFILRWRDLLNLFYEKNMLGSLIKKLIDIVNRIISHKTYKAIANAWLAEILESLLVTKYCKDKKNKKNSTGIKSSGALNFDVSYYEINKRNIQCALLEIDPVFFTSPLLKHVLDLCEVSKLVAQMLMKERIKTMRGMKVNDYYPHTLKSFMEGLKDASNEYISSLIHINEDTAICRGNPIGKICKDDGGVNPLINFNLM